MTHFIPFNRPTFEGNEHRYIGEAIAAGQISGDWHFSKRCNDYLEAELGVRVLLSRPHARMRWR